MTKYKVHIYREMRLSYEGIEAATPEAAAAIARDKQTGDADDIDDCDGETFAALVDAAGDEEYRQSRTIDFEPERQRKVAPKLLDALKNVLASYCYWLPRYGDREAVNSLMVKNASEAIAEAETAGILPASGDRPNRFQFTHEPEEDPDRAYVLVDSRIDVKIVRTAEGIVIDVYSKDGIDIVGTMTVWDEDVAEPEHEASEGAEQP